MYLYEQSQRLTLLSGGLLAASVVVLHADACGRQTEQGLGLLDACSRSISRHEDTVTNQQLS